MSGRAQPGNRVHPNGRRPLRKIIYEKVLAYTRRWQADRQAAGLLDIAQQVRWAAALRLCG
jgi:hypothetical protein